MGALMNEMDELKRKQLARLRGELVDTPLPDDLLEADPVRVSDPEQEGRREREHRELMERYKIQPANEIEPEPFVVGYRRNEYDYLLALPAAKWPSPGEPKTTEISRTHFAEEILVNDANRSLTDCVRWLASRLRNPDGWDDPYSGPPSKLYDTQWSFLVGTWRARGIEVPTELEMQRWAKEYNEKHCTRKKRDE